MEPIVYLKNVNVSLGGKRVLSNLSLQIPRGACVAVIGPNGSGKTSLLRTLAGLITPDMGTVKVLGTVPTRSQRQKKQIGYVPQVRYIDRDFPVTVYDVVLQGRSGRLGLFKRAKKEDKLVVMQSLQKVGMAGLADAQIGSLSGGQQQRTFIARALAQESSLLLLDEPATGLDIPSQQSTYELLEELHQEGVTTITTTHDLLALDFHRFDYVACINKNLVAFGPTAEVLTPDILAKTFSGFPLPIKNLWDKISPSGGLM